MCQTCIDNDLKNSKNIPYQLMWFCHDNETNPIIISNKNCIGLVIFEAYVDNKVESIDKGWKEAYIFYMQCITSDAYIVPEIFCKKLKHYFSTSYTIPQTKTPVVKAKTLKTKLYESFMKYFR